MSSKPSKGGVEKVRAQLKRLAELGTEIAKIKAQLPRLEAAQAEYGEIHRSIPKLLRDMDIDSSGNFGWEGRIVWFLSELANQCIDDGRLDELEAQLTDSVKEPVADPVPGK